MGLFSFKRTKKHAQMPSYAAMRQNILSKESSFFVRESYKSLRTNIRFFQTEGGCRRFCITSSQPGEGKSITLLNLAITFAESGQKVLLIDADLRRPSQARLLIERATPGLSNVLVGHCGKNEAIRKNVYPNLDVLFSGEIPPNPSELLGSIKMKTLIEELSEIYDYVLLDAPPVGMVTDACLIANYLDGVLFVVRQNKTEKDDVARCIQQIKNAGARMLGYVMNGYQGEVGNQYKYSYRRRSKYTYEAVNKSGKE